MSLRSKRQRSSPMGSALRSQLTNRTEQACFANDYLRTRKTRSECEAELRQAVMNTASVPDYEIPQNDEGES